MNKDKQQNDELGEPGEIRQYDRSDAPDTVRGDDLNPNKAPESTPIYLTSDITLQTPEEDAHDRSVDVTRDNTMAASNDDINQPIPSRMAGDSNQGVGDPQIRKMDEGDDAGDNA